jgi:hypothetical protein
MFAARKVLLLARSKPHNKAQHLLVRNRQRNKVQLPVVRSKQHKVLQHLLVRNRPHNKAQLPVVRSKQHKVQPLFVRNKQRKTTAALLRALFVMI